MNQLIETVTGVVLAVVVAALFTWCVVRARTMRPRSPRLIRLSTVALVLLVAGILIINFGMIYIRALFSGAKVTFTELIALRLRSVPVGMVVDGAIVVVELADRRMAEGLDRTQAYAEAAKRMAWPIFSSAPCRCNRRSGRARY